MHKRGRYVESSRLLGRCHAKQGRVLLVSSLHKAGLLKEAQDVLLGDEESNNRQEWKTLQQVARELGDRECELKSAEQILRQPEADAATVEALVTLRKWPEAADAWNKLSDSARQLVAPWIAFVCENRSPELTPNSTSDQRLAFALEQSTADDFDPGPVYREFKKVSLDTGIRDRFAQLRACEVAALLNVKQAGGTGARDCRLWTEQLLQEVEKIPSPDDRLLEYRQLQASRQFPTIARLTSDLQKQVQIGIAQCLTGISNRTSAADSYGRTHLHWSAVRILSFSFPPLLLHGYQSTTRRTSTQRTTLSRTTNLPSRRPFIFTRTGRRCQRLQKAVSYSL